MCGCSVYVSVRLCDAVSFYMRLCIFMAMCVGRYNMKACDARTNRVCICV